LGCILSDVVVIGKPPYDDRLRPKEGVIPWLRDLQDLAKVLDLPPFFVIYCLNLQAIEEDGVRWAFWIVFAWIARSPLSPVVVRGWVK
jgi:hypothetical protein